MVFLYQRFNTVTVWTQCPQIANTVIRTVTVLVVNIEERDMTSLNSANLTLVAISFNKNLPFPPYPPRGPKFVSLQVRLNPIQEGACSRSPELATKPLMRNMLFESLEASFTINGA